MASTSACVRSGGCTLNMGSKPSQHCVGEREVVRRALGGDREPARLGRAHELDGAGGGAVEEVHRRAGDRAELDVAGHDDGLRDRRPARDAEATRPRALVHVPAGGEGLVLGVLGDDRAGQRRRVLERAAHHARAGDAEAVVGEDAHAERVELPHRRELLAGAARR